MKEGQVFKLKKGQEETGLPAEITINKIGEGETIHISSTAGRWESTKTIIESFYDLKEELSAENMPKFAVEALEEAISLVDMFVATQSPIAGLNLKTKLMNLKDSIAKVAGLQEQSPLSLLGKKLS